MDRYRKRRIEKLKKETNNKPKTIKKRGKKVCQ